jgi:hypothetical protein
MLGSSGERLVSASVRCRPSHHRHSASAASFSDSTSALFQSRLVSCNTNALGLLVDPLHTVDVFPPRSSRHTPPPIEPPSRDHFTWDMTPISSALDSSYHSAIPRKQRRFATGWVEHSKYIPHGHIEELSLDRPTNYETSCVQRPRPFEHPYSNMLPPDTTPPPTPDQRFVPLPPVHADDYASDWNAHQHPSSIEQQNQDEGDDFDESVLLLIRDCVNATQEMLSVRLFPCLVWLVCTQSFSHLDAMHFLP